jgi:hypothetical protein
LSAHTQDPADTNASITLRPRVHWYRSSPGVTTQSSVTAHFTVLGVFDDSQAIALDPPISVRTPTAAQCAAAH